MLGMGVTLGWGQTQAPMYGFGSSKCRVFLSEIESRGDLAWGVYMSWSQGYITAANMFMQMADKTGIANFTQDLGTSAQKQTLLDYCKANPESEFVYAVNELFDQLRERAGFRHAFRP